MEADRKFNDRDVRDNPKCMGDIAEAYLHQYTGDFEFLLDMQTRVRRGQVLQYGHVRAVLNCMRMDPRVDLPVEAKPHLYLVTEKPRKMIFESYKPVRRTHWVIKCQFKFECAISTHKQARVVHFIDPIRSKATYYRELHKIGFNIYYQCGTHPAGMYFDGNMKVELLDHEDGQKLIDTTDRWSWCKGCVR